MRDAWLWDSRKSKVKIFAQVLRNPSLFLSEPFAWRTVANPQMRKAVKN
jgi:hypothetical protein